MTNLIKNITWSNVNASNEQIKGYVNNYARDFNVSVSNLVIANGNVSFTTYSKISYENLVSNLIREKYSLNEELAILRQRDTKPTEFNEYNLFAEDCKERAKAFIQERNKALGV